VNSRGTLAETKSDLPLEIAHFLLIDIVGYSKLLVDEQEFFRGAEGSGKLIRVSTGWNGPPFFQSPEEPVRYALEISRALKDHSHI
jgi:hypothetical protein